MYKSQFQKLTLMTGFVGLGHILNYKGASQTEGCVLPSSVLQSLVARVLISIYTLEWDGLVSARGYVTYVPALTVTARKY